MKRLIVILTLAVLALVLWNHFSTPLAETKKSSPRVLAKTDSITERLAARHAQRAVQTQIVSTNSNDDKGDERVKKLSREQIEDYLLKTKRSPESLLNAFEETGDTNFLAEAARKFPDNSLVQWKMLNRASPEERNQWLEKLKRSSPDNAMLVYLSALEKFKDGKIEQAVAEMDAAGNKKIISIYANERSQSREEMYLLSGYSVLDAREKGMASTLSFDGPFEMVELSSKINELRLQYQASGDATSALELTELQMKEGKFLSELKGTQKLIAELMGMSVENDALSSLDEKTFYDFLGMTAEEHLQELRNRKNEFKEMAKNHRQLYFKLSDAEKMIYWDQVKLYGEGNAWRWLNRNYGGGETK